MTMNIYIALFHGRDKEDEDLDDWGYDGPIVGPVSITGTYGTIKLHGPNTTETFIELATNQAGDLYKAGNKFYGDFELITACEEGNVILEALKEAKREIWSLQQYIDSFSHEHQACNSNEATNKKGD
jgi:hypothetical protein